MYIFYDAVWYKIQPIQVWWTFCFFITGLFSVPEDPTLTELTKYKERKVC